MGGDLYVDLYMEVAISMPMQTFYTLASEAERGAGLGAGRNFDRCLAMQCRDLNFGAKRCLNEIDRDLAYQIVALSLKDFMGFDVQHDIEITGWAAAQTGFSTSAGTKPSACINASRNS